MSDLIDSDLLDLPTTQPLTPSESLMWQLDAEPSLQFRIVGVLGLDSPPAMDVLTDRVERMTRNVARFRHRVVPRPVAGLRPHWELDPHFDLSYHLRTVRLPDGSGDADLLRFASLARQDDFPASRSPWRVYVVTGLPEGRAALVVTMHHVITDGVGAIRLGALLFDLDRSGRTRDELGAVPPVSIPRQRNAADRLLTSVTQETDGLSGLLSLVRGAAGGVRDPLRSGRTLVEAATAAVRFADPTATAGSPMPRPVSPDDRYLTLRAPVEQLKAAARAGGGRLNDAYVAVLVGGIRRYHDLHGMPLGTLKASIPVNVRPADSTAHAGNDVLLKLVSLPADLSDPAARIAAIRSLTAREQTAGSHLVSRAMAQALSRIPGPALRAATESVASTVDFAATNVPGVPVPLFLAGAKVESMHAFVSRVRAPLMAALVSYDGVAHIALNVDPAAIPDPDTFAACVRDELESVLSLAVTV